MINMYVYIICIQKINVLKGKNDLTFLEQINSKIFIHPYDNFLSYKTHHNTLEIP